MPTWLLKTEPSEYSFADLTRDKKTVWEGVANHVALGHMRKVKKGDKALIYHTGKEKALVGLARIASDAYPDPKAGNEKVVVFDLEPLKPLEKLVTLAQIKADARFKDFPLVRIGRLSVMPVPPEIEKALLKMAGM